MDTSSDKCEPFMEENPHIFGWRSLYDVQTWDQEIMYVNSVIFELTNLNLAIGDKGTVTNYAHKLGLQVLSLACRFSCYFLACNTFCHIPRLNHNMDFRMYYVGIQNVQNLR